MLDTGFYFHLEYEAYSITGNITVAKVTSAGGVLSVETEVWKGTIDTLAGGMIQAEYTAHCSVKFMKYYTSIL